MKLTPTVMKEIVKAVKETYLPLSRIAGNSDITYETLRNWLRSGEEYKQQIEEGKIMKGSLSTKQKREVDLFSRVEKARTDKESGYLERIDEIAEKNEDIKAFQWQLKIQNRVYRDNAPEMEEEDAEVDPQEVFVCHLYGKDSNDTTLFDPFLKRSPDGADGASNTDGTEDEVRS